jgi:GTPase SAR1 family protein
VVLLGDARAGKIAMVNRLLTDKFSEVRLRKSEREKKKIKNQVGGAI